MIIITVDIVIMNDAYDEDLKQYCVSGAVSLQHFNKTITIQM